ncbi:chromosome partitioning protein ParA [Aurantimonas sp. MSK8Z-1]|uniref:chromosome partitioning protein ParA n=1 Tax=Mangrovibrevibacter kandeliae TaxID=2968473 RepID=UPI002118E047|nr:chromosome partitioning protein ParA [Aurantimonas sp. MSK8Z-1]MCW4114930.1 chromosome partitioning protein ParA [Aurantimonas sp. MSK8Z-1]
MASVLAVGSLKTAGSTTLALTLASVAAAAEIPVILVDGARDADLLTWSALAGRPSLITVERVGDVGAMERLVRAGRRDGSLVILDCGDRADFIKAGARLSDRAIIPLRFSPLSAYAALATEMLLASDAKHGRRGRDWCLAASAVATIPSRVARAVEAIVSQSVASKISIGLTSRAAYEAPFIHGGTIFTLEDIKAPGLDRSRAEAACFAYEVGILGRIPRSAINSYVLLRAAA